MLKRIAIMMVLLMGSALVMNGQTTNKTDARALLIELNKMLKEIPATKESCAALLMEIKAWQEKNLKKLDSPKVTLRITSPPDKSGVIDQTPIEGTVADPKANVWVIVHPMGVSNCWVQPAVTVKEDGTWKVLIYIGRPGDIDTGKAFEIMAVANPNESLEEGKILDGWPDAQWKSQVIEVTRK